MKRLFFFVVVFLVVQSFFFLEEETLVILCSVVWFDAAGGFIRKALESELENRGDIIKSKFVWYLTQKEVLLNELVMLHEDRYNFVENLIKIYSYYVIELLNRSLGVYLLELSIVQKYVDYLELVISGGYTLNDILLLDLENVLAVVDKNEIHEFDWLNTEISV